MALELHIPPCVKSPPHPLHRPLETIQKLLLSTSWHLIKTFPQLGELELTGLTHEKLYGGKSRIDYYGVTFDHLVLADDPYPDVLAINIIEVYSDEEIYTDGGKYANEVLLFSIRPSEYMGKKVLARKQGTKDRIRINTEVAERMAKTSKHLQM
ncbi:hypothetical protein GQ44DRAFT_742871 [Phaeosphaeriaceae sp. PMI808]|nr:hypothetical protein GQ44DRAFT_742871 [Phaeosphaeriaceae sp. PMI808]